MATSFVNLPTELIESIAGHLHLSDLCNLRFVCRDVNFKVTETSHFRSFCSHKNIELWKATVDDLETRLREPGLHRYLEHLTLTGVLLVTAGLERIIREGTKPADLEDPWSLREYRKEYLRMFKTEETLASPSEIEDAKSQLSDFKKQIDTDKAERQTGLDVIALAKLFQTIAARCKAGRLKSLTLHLVVRREKTTSLPPRVSARHVQFVPRAEQILSCALQAWERSGINIEHLDVFTGTKGCAVQTLAFTTLQKNVNFKNLPGMKALSLSISTRMLPPDGLEKMYFLDRDAELLPRGSYGRQDDTYKDAQRALLQSPDNNTGLVAFLNANPHIEHLSIRSHIIKTIYATSDEHDAVRATLFAALARIPLPSLRTLTLTAAYLSADTLLTLLQNSPHLRTLHVRDVTLHARPGHAWTQIFSHATSPSSNFSSLRISNIYEDMTDETPKIFGYVICATPGLEPGACVRTGEGAAERLRRLGMDDSWSFEQPGPDALMAFELEGREHVLRGVECRVRDWAWGPGYRNRDPMPKRSAQGAALEVESEGLGQLNPRFVGDRRRAP